MVSGINNNRTGLYAYGQSNIQQQTNTFQQDNIISFQSSKPEELQANNLAENNEKVSFGEGVKLVGKGFLNKILDIGKSIVQHPIRTLATVGLTTLALSALPLVGITAATGAAALALGFAGYALFNTGKDVVKAVKHNSEGNYNNLRKDLENIGGDGVDLALSLPFVPKAINQIKRFAKYGTSTVGINKELIANLKNAKSIGDVQMEFAKAKTLIDYEMIGNEMGLTLKPKLVFKDLPFENGAGIAGAYEPTSAELQINTKTMVGKNKLIVKLSGLDTETLIRHELEHFRQFSDIARSEGLGLEGLTNTLSEYYKGISAQLTPSQMKQMGISPEVVENMINGDKTALNRAFYQQVIDVKGPISAGTAEADLAQQYAQGFLEKIYPKAENVAAYQESISGLNMSNPLDQIKAQKAMQEFYKKNILEKEAYAVQDVFNAANIKMRPGMTIANLDALSVASDFDEIA